MKHRTLTEIERKNFLELFQDQIRKSKIKLTVADKHTWLIYLNFLIIVTYLYGDFSISSIAAFALGVLSLQIIFIASHVSAHALFLEYENYNINSDRCVKALVHYFAFYHHHHTITDNWAPELSFYTKTGAQNIIIAHWYSYSMLRIGFEYICLAVWINPILLYYLLGYECAVWILPYAHGWQHLQHQCDDNISLIPSLILPLLEVIGLIANSKDHHKHHKHDHPAVYQSFSSSGIYMPWIDNWIDQKWNEKYQQAISEKKYLYDLINPYTYVVQIMAFATFPSIVMIPWIIENLIHITN